MHSADLKTHEISGFNSKASLAAPSQEVADLLDTISERKGVMQTSESPSGSEALENREVSWTTRPIEVKFIETVALFKDLLVSNQSLRDEISRLSCCLHDSQLDQQAAAVGRVYMIG